jgi:hypothetical protein
MADLQRALLEVGATAQPAPVAQVRVPIPPGAVNAPGGGHATPRSSTTLSASAHQLDESFELPRHRVARPLLIAGAALLIAGGAVIAVRSLGGGGAASDDEAQADSAPIKPPPVTSAKLIPAPAPANGPPAPALSPRPADPPSAAQRGPAAAPAPARITIDLRTSPTEARVVDADDGTLIGVTPLHEVRDRGEDALQVRIEKPGFVPRTVHISQRQDYRGTIRLERVGGGEARAPREAPESGGEHIIKL